MANKYLALYLKRAGRLTGPSCLETRHSALSVLKKVLLGGVPDTGYKAYNNFGSAVHSLFLVNKKGRWKLNPIEHRTREMMVKSLKSHPIVNRLLSQCHTFEKRKKTKLNGVKLGFTPDGHGNVIGIDLKTTACTDLKDFEIKAFEYGYFRQGRTYSIPLKLKEFWIIGIGKKPPFSVFIILTNNFKDWMHYAEKELEFLLYIYKNYGTFKKRKKSKRNSKRLPKSNRTNSQKKR